ncbi:MAG: hypothetical protein J6K17_05350 [Oscillospiraceae bacterium]|nr:hypothetical protein [Oscillospiraceae bacterium]
MTHIFIINPFAGHQTFADDLRTKLAEVKNLDYFVFNTRYKGYETELVRKILHIFEGEKLRFYCCGGSGTMRNMLNGFDSLDDVEVAFFPCGLTNDFLKNFGKDEARFHNIEELINGDVIKVDYIKTNYGISLNSLSTGMDSNCLGKMNDFRIFRFIGKDLPYTLATLYSIFVSNPHEYEITLDDEKFTGKFAEIFIGNGCVFGGNMFFADKTCVNDGKAISRLVGNKKAFTLLPELLDLQNKKHDKIKKNMLCSECSRVTIRRSSGSDFSINHDGDLISGVSVCEAEIVHKGLNFVVPKGVTVNKGAEE